MRFSRKSLAAQASRAFSLMFLSLLAAASAPLDAKVYFINRGIKYHLGDNHYEHSEDALFVGTYPLVGKQWLQAFTVDRADHVKVRIEGIWGVDDCDYCRDIVAIDGKPMGRLMAENNHRPFDTPAPLAYPVEPGHTYLLTITSFGTDQVDDFVVEGVSVETEQAVVTLLRPGPVLRAPEDPVPALAPPPPPRADPCGGLKTVPAAGLGDAGVELAGADAPAQQALVELHPGEACAFEVQVEGAAQPGDQVSQELAVLLDTGETSGWAFSFAPGGTKPAHGDLLLQGRYTAEHFRPAAPGTGAWARARLAWCQDSTLHLQVNGEDTGVPLHLDLSQAMARIQALGMTLRLRRGEAP